MATTVGYIGVDHHHRDPYFAIASGLDAACESAERDGWAHV